MPGRRLLRAFQKLLHQASEPLTVATENRRCLHCAQTLQPVASGQRTVLGCPGCEGIWLEATTLATALSESALSDELRGLIEGQQDAEIAHTFAPSRQKRSCPDCQQTMDNDAFEDSGVWIDVCPEGHGIWLDRGELKLLRQRRLHPPSQPTGTQGQLDNTVTSLLLDFL